MEFIDGATLREKIHQEPTDLKKLLRYLQHVAEGLAKAHAAGIVHRDLKPDNVMITRDGHAKILDFGLAKLIETQKLSSTSSDMATAIMPQQSQPGTVLGTVGYMSPEQAQGRTNEIDHRSDVFSFGCMLYEAVTGRKAFAGADAIDTLNKIIREPTPLVSEIRSDAPGDLQRIIRRCLAKDPEDRYQTIKDVATELKELRREMTATAPDKTGAQDSRSQPTEPASVATNSQQPVDSTATPSVVPSMGALSADSVVTGIKRHKLAIGLGLVVLI